jgi:PAS domain S-box-containing protein
MLDAALFAIPVPACGVDAHGMIVAVNALWRAFGQAAGAPEAFCEAGVPYLQVLGQGCTPPEVLTEIASELERVRLGMASEFLTDFDCVAFAPPLSIRVRAVPFETPEGPMTIVTHVDRAEVVAARRAEEAAAERLTMAGRAARIGTWDYDLRSGELVWDDTQLELYGITREAFEGGRADWVSALHPSDRERAVAALERSLATGTPFEERFRIVQPSGHQRYLRGIGVTHCDAAGKPIRILGANWDVTAEELASNRLRDIVQTLPDAVLVLDAQGRLVHENQAARDLFGITRDDHGRRQDRHFSDALPYPRRDDGRVAETEMACIDRAGERFPARVAVALLPDPEGSAGVVVSVQDRTEREALESELRRSQRFQAMGALAGAVAHDFNNMLVAMLSGAELIQACADEPHRVRRLADDVLEAATRARTITAQLLTLSRKPTVPTYSIDIGDELRGILRALQPTMPSTMSVSLDAPRGLQVAISEAHLHQIISNLVVNARDALRHRGHIAIAAVRDDTRGCVLIRVEDDGPGIPEAMLEQVFEPFTTSKGPRKGTGLGLAIAYSLVAQASGTIRVSNRPTTGCCFEICLPGSGLLTRERQPAPKPQAGSPGRGRLLVVEDDASVRAALVALLHSLGLEVDAYERGELALERLASERYDALLSDVSMPGLDGIAVAERAASLDRALPIGLMTGFTTADVHAAVQRGLVREVLHKPFTREELYAYVQRLVPALRLPSRTPR